MQRVLLRDHVRPNIEPDELAKYHAPKRVSKRLPDWLRPDYFPKCFTNHLKPDHIPDRVANIVRSDHVAFSGANAVPHHLRANQLTDEPAHYFRALKIAFVVTIHERADRYADVDADWQSKRSANGVSHTGANHAPHTAPVDGSVDAPDGHPDGQPDGQPNHTAIDQHADTYPNTAANQNPNRWADIVLHGHPVRLSLRISNAGVCAIRLELLHADLSARRNHVRVRAHGRKLLQSDGGTHYSGGFQPRRDRP